MLRSCLEQRQLDTGGASVVDERLTAKGEGIELAFDAQAFDHEGCVNGHKYVNILHSQCSLGDLAGHKALV